MASSHRLVAGLHRRMVRSRRAAVLAAHLAELLPRGARVLDVGTGEGEVAALLVEARPDLALEGIDVLIRPELHVPVKPFDGARIPHEDASFDVVQFVDVLHHTGDPLVLLREARRVARDAVLIKDHQKTGFLAGPTLRLMDWVGNHYEGVSLPYNYWTPAQWDAAREELGMVEDARRTRLDLRRPPLSWLFDRSLHFVARWRRAPVEPA